MRSKFKLTRVTAAVVLATTGMATMQSSMAGPGFADIVLQDGTAARKATFFAYSPSGQRVTPVPEAADLAKYPTGNFTGKALRKFVDPLPLPGAANAKMMADGTTSKYLPVAVASKWVKPDGSTSNDDYYEIAVVEFTDKFHSDLKKATTLRGYVQIDHNASNGRAPLPGSQSFALTYPDGTAIMIAGTDANGKLTGGKVPALAVEKPRFLGPVIAATKGTPTRLKFLNLLPTGRAELGTPDAAGKPVMIMQRHGDIFLPVDKSIMGAGVGPDGQTEFTQNRADIHLHGGDTPWISDGTPHQWITPGDEADAAHPRSLAKAFNDAANALDPTLLPNYLRGASAANVPDMYDPGAGAMTYYFPNGQSARMLWYHDHTVGATRLNVYAGMASGYLLTDAKEQELINNGTLPPAARTIPLVLQDRTFVPDDIALQDGRWNTSAWGQPGDSWFPHVYETVQDPEQQNNWNAVGRWHYGPWFWPVFPALYSLPTGEYSLAGAENTVTTTPEAWMDTPIVNGVAYPVLEVDPTTYRFRILNASNDRMMTFNLFEGKSTATLADGTPVTATHPWLDANGNPVVYPDGTPATFPVKTEIDMMPAAAPLPADACPPGQTRPSLIGTSTTKYCTPDTWPTDNRLGGVPTPASVGPALYQIANESGWLAKVNKIEPTPIAYIQDKGRITVLNPDTMALFLGPAERADVVVDFSQYAGKTLIVYNDSGAPVPAGDPRNDLFTGVGDQAGSGGAEDTKPGYGPNTRTMMQIRVKALAANQQPAAPLNVAALETGISDAYFATQERPVVAQPDYAGFDPAWSALSPTQSYANIYTGSLKEPTFKFTPGTPLEGINSVKVLTGGTGYVQAPVVTIAPPVTAAGVPVAGGKTATALATMKIDAITVTNPGTGYTMAPVMTIIGGGGNGATASATLANFVPTITAGGTGYTGVPTVTFTAPPTGGVRATGQAVVTNGVVTGITMTNGGSGYVSSPLVSITGGGGTGARATTAGGIGAVKVVAPDPAVPSTAGGGGYTDMAAVQINFVGGNGTGAAASATGKVFDITLTHPGSGYVNTAVPSVTLSAPPVGGTTATAQSDMAAGGAAQGSILVKTKTIQELFDPTYGRLNATLGVELPFTSALTQTTIPLGYVDEPTEQFADGETQIWKITHNGVDTHPVHFHLLNVQLINRVGWDGFITPPLPQEIGWKETVKMHPLEDVIVAVRAKKPTLDGFGLPLSRRLMDPTQPQGSPFGFTQIDPTSGNPKTVVNDIINYGWEYVWHCHILGHEENDFMRPVIFNANEGRPTAPTPVSAELIAGAGVKLLWTDTSATEYQFEVFRAEVQADGVTIGAFTPLTTSLANATTFTDASALNVAAPALAYKIVAVGAAGRAESTTIVAPLQLAAPMTPTAFAAAANSGTQVTLNWAMDPASAKAAGLLLERSLDGGATWAGVTPATAVNGSNPVVFTNLPATATSYVDTTLTKDTTVQYRLSAANLTGASALTQATVDTLGAPAVTALSNVIDVAAATPKVTLSWTVAAPVRAQVISRFDVVRTTGAGVSTTFTVNDPAALGYVDSTVQQNVTYTYVVNAVNANGITPVTGASMSTQAVMPFGAAGPLTTFTSAATAAGTLPTRVTLNWAAATPATSYVLTRLCTATTSTTPCAVGPVTVGTYASMPVGGVIDSTVAPLSSYTYTLTAINGDNPAQSTATTSVTTPAGVIAPTNLGAVVSFANGTATLTWTDQATNETSFLVQRSSNGGLDYVNLGNVAPRTGSVGLTRTFTDNAAGGFVAGGTYLYRVIAQNVTAGVTNDSAPSNVVTVNYFLGAPTGLTAAATGPSSITLNWVDGSTAEASFAVWRSTDGGVTWGAAPIATVARTAALGLATGGAVTYVDTNTAAKPVVSGVTYTYRVTAVNGPVASAPSNTIDASIAAPATPTGLTAAITAANRVTLNWVDASTTETAFAVWRSDGVNNVQVGTVTRTAAQATATAGAVTFQDNGVAPNGFVPGTTYAYTVTATNGTGATSASAPTAPVNVAWVVPAAPDTVTAFIASTTRVTVSWADTSNNETSFTVLRSDNGAAAVPIGTVTRTAAQGTAVGGALLTFNNNNSAATPLVLGHTYTYTVRANNLVGGSVLSSPVDVVFAAPAAPAALAAPTITITSATRANVTLNWPAPAAGITYTVQRIRPAALGGGTTTLLTNTTATTFTDLNLKRSATAAYVYQIRANQGPLSSAYVQTSVIVN